MSDIVLSSPFNQLRLADELVAAGRDTLGRSASVLAVNPDNDGNAASGTVRFFPPIVQATVQSIISAHNATGQNVQKQIAALAAIIAAFGQQVPMETGAADVVITSNQPQNITGLSFPIGKNENWHAQWTLFVNGSTAGMKFCLSGPTAPVSVKMSAFGNTTSDALHRVAFSTVYGTLTGGAGFIANATPFTGRVQIDAHVSNGANPGTVQLQFASTTNGQSNRVNARSFGRAWRAAV